MTSGYEAFPDEPYETSSRLLSSSDEHSAELLMQDGELVEPEQYFGMKQLVQRAINDTEFLS